MFARIDLTKRYNRMKQYVHATDLARSKATANSAPTEATNAILPASNRAEPVTLSSQASRTLPSHLPIHNSKVDSTLATLSAKFHHQINLAPLFQPTSTANRKGGSEKVNWKDKSDRATNEQVLDPRTRLILFKMLGRGFLIRVDGCVSTGKEVRIWISLSVI